MQTFLIAGSGVALLAAIVFLVRAALRAGKLNAIYAYAFFVISMLILALYMFLWHIGFGRVGQEIQSVAGSAPVDSGLGQWGQILGGGIVAALLTLAGREAAIWWRRPKFKVEFDNKEPYCRKPGLGLWPNAGESYWIRLKVINSGRSVAKTCTGRLVKFVGGSGELEGHDLVQLHWINTLLDNQALFKPIDLNQREHDFLDLLVTRPEHPRQALLFMSPVNLFSNNPDAVPQGTCRIQVTVYGENVKPCSKEYSISWAGSNYTDIRLKEE